MNLHAGFVACLRDEKTKMTPMAKWASHLRLLAPHAFVGSRKGNVGFIFALMSVPIIMSVGAAVDYSRATLARFALQRAIDAAALGAAREAKTAVLGNDPDWRNRATGAAQRILLSNAVQFQSYLTGTPTINVSLSGNAISAQVTSQGQMPTAFMKIAGIGSVPFQVKASASEDAPLFTDIHIAIDVSMSMGIGATTADQKIMETAIGCVVACHVTDIYGNPNTAAAARAAGATLRIDAVKASIVAALKTIPSNGRTRVAIYAFSNSLTTMFPLSSDINGAITATQSLDMTNSANQGGTNAGYSLSQLSAMLTKSGDGLTQANAIGTVILATDAVENNETLFYANGVSEPMDYRLDPNFAINGTYMTDAWGITVKAFDPLSCTALKAKGYKMMVLQMPYVIAGSIPSAWAPRVDFFENTLSPVNVTNMTACASAPANYMLANTPVEISKAVQSMLTATISGLRLTQ